MKKTVYMAVCATMMLFLGSCRNDWTIKDMPPVPEKAAGAGYVTGFDSEDASIVIPVQVESAGSHTVTVRGRAVSDEAAGTGTISAGTSSATLTFNEAYVWSDCEVSLELQAGVNEIIISGANGNGAFQVDYIDVK